jgi:DivIVA domain-containing protein
MRAADVRDTRFAPVTFREGYDMDAVDAFLARIEAALAADEQSGAGVTGLTPEDVVSVKFTPTKFRQGYSQDGVDDFLDRVVTELHQRAR